MSYRHTPLSSPRLDRATQYSSDGRDSTERPQRAGSPAFAGDDDMSYAADRIALLNRLPRIRHRRGQSAVHRNRLAVDIRGLVACQKQSHRGEFVRLARPLERIELADLVGGAALLGA